MAVRVTQEQGRWYLVEYRDGRRTLHRSFGRGAKAQLMAEDARGEIDRERRREALGLVKPVAHVRFGAYAEQWLREVITPHRTVGTAQSYAQLLRDHLIPEFGALALGDIKPPRIQAFIARKLVEANKPRGQAGPRKARATVRNMIAVLRACLNHAVDVDGHLTNNPAAKFGKRYFGGSTAARGLGVEIYDEEEIARQLQTATRYYPDYELYIRTLFYTGQRVGELLGLQWGDFDFQSGFVIIRRAVQIHHGQLRVAETKTHRARAVDLADTLVARWMALRSIREAEAAVAGRALAPWCCPSVRAPATRPLNRSWLNAKVWARICHHAGLRRLRIHDLRHTYASLQLRRGKPMEYVQQQLGHTAIDTTIRLYAHFKAGASRFHANDLAAGIERYEPVPPPEPSALDPVRVRAPEGGSGTPHPPANHPETTRPVART